MGNDASSKLLAVVADGSLLAPNANMLRVVFHPLGVRRYIVNWPDVARVLLDRAERELLAAGDAAATALLDELRDYANDVPRPATRRLQSDDVLLPVHLRKDGIELRMFSTIMTIGTPQDITLQELRVETFFPADEPSESTWRALMQ
jgi:hypothetical protein